ncbi:hypothetical protein NE857_05215 [Nocardiopsis exhalans]|uniref:DUF4190 domain-containing protein n=1 Tax=Nocardiopsis exhalans TaxID=163604 RepID=A0ABY5DD31_9ACTN|nr:hypothetical protein [Nocardiopsis exhalans]USY21042.1 hypothetical protein NE857_05215 [Nocardiopsis exhalans]
MTENGGGAPGNRGSEADADSWFKPSENRNRTQSEYQDPLEQEGAPEGDAPEGGAVFPDSGGYAGLSASRPAMVEPYPDLGAPPVTPPAAPPATEQPPYAPGAISYPGAGASAYQPVTRIPGESDPLAAPQERPVPWEPQAPREPEGFPADEGPRTPEAPEAQAAPQAYEAPTYEAPTYEAPPAPEEPAPTGGYPGIAASADVPLPPEDPQVPSEPAHDSWATGTNDSWTPEPAPAQPAPERFEVERPAEAQAWAPRPERTEDTWTPEALVPEAPLPEADTWSPRTERPVEDEPWGPGPVEAQAWAPRPEQTEAEAWAARPEDAWTPPAEASWAPQAAPEPAVPAVDEPWSPRSAQSDWTPPAEELRQPEPAREQPDEWPGAGGLDSWSPTPDTGDAWKGAGTTEPWADPADQQWSEPAHTPSPTGDQYDDELSPRPAPHVGDSVSAPAPSYGTDRYDDELSPPAPAPSDAVPADEGGLGSGSGNTWAFDRDDPRLPDVVRDAERRRRESAPEEPVYSDWGVAPESENTAQSAPERESGPDTGELSAAVATSDDPLAAIADMQSRAKAKEPQEVGEEEAWASRPERTEAETWASRPEPTEYAPGPDSGQQWDDHSWDAPARAEAAWDQDPLRDPLQQPEPAAWGGTPGEGDESWRGGEGATQMFTAPSFEQAPEPDARGARTRDHSDYDELGFDDRGRGERGHPDQGYGEQGFAGQGYTDQDHRDQGYDDRGYGDFDGPDTGRGYDDQAYDDRGYGDQGYADDQGDDQQGHGRQGYADRGHESAAGPFTEDRFDGAPEIPEAPERVGRPAEDRAPEGESDYEDGFTPADYGMPEQPKPAKRRRDKIAEDFPGFDEARDDGDYPGYDSIDFLADTEPGANVTLWLGLASVIPVVGVITAILALFVTGPKAKKAIRESRGTLDGLGLITTGTVFAVIGIVVTVISVAIWFVV